MTAFTSPRAAGRSLNAAFAVLGVACMSSVVAHAVSIDMVTVGDPGNAADTTGYGAVNYEYRIGKHEITIGQYAEFLNAVAKSDPYGLWNSNMQLNLNIAGIERSGSSGAYTYDVMTVSGSAPYGGVSNANRPITYVSWLDAARFANWMHNGQGSGSTETGAYTLDGMMAGNRPAKNEGARFSIPTENEWYKAAYYKGGGTSAGYWDYAVQADESVVFQPGNAIGGEAYQLNYQAYYAPPINDSLYAVTRTNASSYSSGQNYLTDVGAFSGSPSAYGTFDQNGNVYEYNDLNPALTGGVGLRGGSWDNYGTSWFTSSYRNSTGIAGSGSQVIGFRLAAPIAPVPEPSTYYLALGGLACAGFSAWRRRTQA
jgi:formylglycine-generating enzyme